VDIFPKPPQELEGYRFYLKKTTTEVEAAQMNFYEYQQLAERTANQTDPKERFINFAFGLAGETGEVIDYLKKHLFHGHLLDREKLKIELGDVLWYLATIATTAGISLEEIAKANIAKLKVRYPDGFSEEKSIKRNERDETP